MLKKEEFEDINKRVNLTWFYPKICLYQDRIADQRQYFGFLDSAPEKKAPVLLYVHIPYCESFCAYCACFKEPLRKYSYEERKLFVGSLQKEMAMYSRTPFFQDSKIGYVQFGGGTPSCLENDLLESIIAGINKYFDLTECRGISLEGNVMSLKDLSRVRLLKDLGVERISFGVQTFNEGIRKQMNIKASLEDIYETVAAIKKAGIPSYALDLIYNLPDQNMEILESDLDRACRELNPMFIQTYQFNLFHNTALKEKVDRGYFQDPPTLKKEMEMFAFVMDRLAKNGYKNQVLINLFSDRTDSPWTGIELSMGNNREYGSYMLGLGPGSMSYIAGHSYRTFCSIKEYIDSIGRGLYAVEAGHVCTDEELKNRVMVFFPNFTKIPKKDVPAVLEILEKTDDLLEAGYLSEEGDALCLTEKGKMWAGNISYYYYSEQEKARIQRSFYHSLKNRKNTFNQDDMNVAQKQRA
ncbi:MAG: coproporphyrinogen-III oxidase family protein [Peptococcaceae bacterium]|jgi:oxygen-independent coproporphyrinogen-3 oxidase|nr:coproporphyrinogen III oxidase family protein [Peptococcaceae bacterium]MDH7524221.1 coproporphyrinogen-III oxidase family protein [Peptococcaceae bacterium]